MLTKYGLRINSKLCSGNNQINSLIRYKAYFKYDGFRMFRSTNVLMKNSGDKQTQNKKKSKQNNFEQFKEACYQKFSEDFKTISDNRLEEIIKIAYKKYQKTSRFSQQEKSEESTEDMNKNKRVEDSINSTLNDPAEKYKNFLSNLSGNPIDISQRISAKEEENINNMNTAELFGFSGVFSGLSADEKKAVDIFVAEFDSLKKLRIEKEFEEAKKVSQDRKSQSKQTVNTLMNELKEFAEKSNGMMSKDYPYHHQEHKWILEGMNDYYFDSNKTITQKVSDKIQEKQKGDELIKEFVSSMKGENRNLIKQKAYKAIGQLFIEYENKHFGERIDISEEYHEPTKEELRENLKGLLIKKLKGLKPKKPKLETSGLPLLDKDEFIGQDEIIDAFISDKTEEFPEIITDFEYKQDEIEKNKIPEMSDVYLLQRGVSKSKPTTSYLKEIGDKIEEIRDVSKHNHEVGEEYKKGQEGVDYNYANPESDPRFLTQRKIKKMFKGQLEPKEFDEKKFKDPKSKQAEFERNRNRIFNLNIKKSEIKEYPGSPNGKLPEEDKAFYSNWYMSNRPESLKSIEEEVINPIIEANRRKIPRSRRDQKGEERTHESNEFYYFKNFDKEFRLNDQENIPVWDIVEDKEHDTFHWYSMSVVQENNPEQKYEYDEWDSKMELIDTSQMGFKQDYDTSKLHDISVIPFQMPLEFNETVFHAHNWAQFRIMPHLIYEVSQFKIGLKEYVKSKKEAEIPSLWAYYENLPEWCRENHFVRCVLMALEKTKPLLPIRTKEIALNYACSFLVPIDQKTDEILEEMFNSKRVRLNHEKARQMMQELPKYDIELDQLGTDYWNVLEEKTAPGKVYDKDERLNVFDKIDQNKPSFEDDWKEVSKATNLDRFEIDKDTEQNALKDFVCKPYPKSTFSLEDPKVTYPLKYYDNDDNFWDDFIEEKRSQYDKMSMILKRPYLKH